MKDVPRIPAAELPSDIASALHGLDAPTAIRRHDTMASDRSMTWLFLPVVALATFGALTALLVPAPPFSGLSAAALVLGTTALGALLAASRRHRLRPNEGQVMVVGKSSLALVDYEEVHVLPAESILVAEGKLLFRGVAFDEGSHDEEFLAALREAVEAGKRGDKDDWRNAASLPEKAVDRKKRVAVGAGAGLLVGLVVELVPLGGGASASWDDLEASFEGQVAWMDSVQDGLEAQALARFTKRLATMKDTPTLLNALRDVEGRGFGNDYIKPTRARLAEVVTAELKAATATKSIEPLARIAGNAQVPPTLAKRIRVRYAEAAVTELAEEPTAERYSEALTNGRALGIGAEYRSRVVEHMAETHGARLAEAKSGGELVPFVRICLVHELEAPFCGTVRESFQAQAAITARSADEDLWAELRGLTRIAADDEFEELEEALQARALTLAVKAVDGAETPQDLADAVSSWYGGDGDEDGARLRRRIETRAARLAPRVATSKDAALVVRLLPEDEQPAFFEKYREMAAAEARNGGLDEVRSFLLGPDFFDHPARAEIEERLVKICEATYSVPGLEDPKVEFVSAILGEMCRRNTTVIPYVIGAKTEVENTGDEGPKLAELVTEVSKLIGAPIEAESRLTTSRALLELYVEGFEAPIGSLKYPCTLHVKRLFKWKGPEKVVFSGKCFRVYEPVD